VIIGSALIEEMERAGPAAALSRAGAFVASIRTALDQPAAVAKTA
jgi:tryptophan synthase alpha subunit